MSSSRVLNLIKGSHALSADVQHAGNNILLAGTVASGGVAAANVLTSGSTFASTLAHQFSSVAVPGLAVTDGACRFALGLTDMLFAWRYSEEQMLALGMSRKDLFLRGAWEAAKGVPEFYYGLQALHFGSFNLGCYGLAITNTLDCLGEVISWIRNSKRKPSGLIKPLVKGLEAAGWWLLAFGHPMGWACLAAVLLYKLWKGDNLYDQLKQDGAAVLTSISTLFSGKKAEAGHSHSSSPPPACKVF